MSLETKETLSPQKSNVVYAVFICRMLYPKCANPDDIQIIEVSKTLSKEVAKKMPEVGFVRDEKRGRTGILKGR
jgi:hypothetical protein